VPNVRALANVYRSNQIAAGQGAVEAQYNLGLMCAVLLQIEIAEDRLAAFEWIEEGKTYREWLVPAAVLKGAGTVGLAVDETGP
jgi:hypothetical protein